ncbi:Hypothetical predicted protein [Pelobates cultripes]|uniref:Cytokine receptor-like factor 2-like D2 domain-containing protein n=1 Tax=Pelobates cultripes TaxID=61616 RepID=A0AAD1VL08_PELCU|nr:Hypothetical predicted protein [Pelobates cultripes]
MASTWIHIIILGSCLLVTQLNAVDEEEAFIINPPENVTIQWHENDITIYCKNPDIDYLSICYEMKMRFKSSNTNHWEKSIVSLECMGFIPFYCTFDGINLDPEKCYLIELQFLGLRHCFNEDIESVWGPNISLVKGMDSDTCMKNEDIRKDSVSYGFANLLYISSALLLVVIFITSLACATKRYVLAFFFFKL